MTLDYGGGAIIWLKLPKDVDAEILRGLVEPEGVYFETGGFTFADEKNNRNHARATTAGTGPGAGAQPPPLSRRAVRSRAPEHPRGRRRAPPTALAPGRRRHLARGGHAPRPTPVACAGLSVRTRHGRVHRARPGCRGCRGGRGVRRQGVLRARMRPVDPLAGAGPGAGDPARAVARRSATRRRMRSARRSPNLPVPHRLTESAGRLKTRVFALRACNGGDLPVAEHRSSGSFFLDSSMKIRPGIFSLQTARLSETGPQ